MGKNGGWGFDVGNWACPTGFFRAGLWAEVQVPADVPAFRCTSAALRCRFNPVINPALAGQPVGGWFFNWALSGASVTLVPKISEQLHLIDNVMLLTIYLKAQARRLR